MFQGLGGYFLTSCREAEQCGCWAGLRRWVAVSAAMRAGRRAEDRAVRRASLAGRGRWPARGSPEQTGGRRAVQENV